MLSFGTDGVRGVANQDLTPELALALGRASARVLGGDAVVIGRDTRRSGPMLEAALAAGYASEGVAVTLLGVVPTPTVAHAAAALGVPGAMISASHNPFADNGIKLFAAGGTKLSDEAEDQLEAELAHLLGSGGGERPTGAGVGPVTADDGRLARAYADDLHRAVGGRRLQGISVVLDCAHGAASALAPEVLRAAGVEVTVVHADPDGVNINDDAGSTSPAALQRAVIDHGADVGLALDGDADRLLAIDSDGALVDGDHVIAILAIDRQAQGRLPDDTVVATVMSNLGFRQGMARRGITVVDTKVGDRYVLEALARTGAALGGEQSGHVIQADIATTGDGLLTALTLLDVVHRTGRPLADLAADAMTSLPQVLVNVRLDHRDPDLVERLAADVADAEARLGDEGRVLVRPSGTEPLIRVMVEAPTAERAQQEADTLAAAVRRLAGA
ncbi:phosphoglucosamine mutase [Acidimicrobiia bacterium EGI L10123]|uniref:phosphoglucosamine mutase n=1 Tax=Salinilacustrithrix flava TaxID=2957203 RepID=UPI003D7C33F2|nr:phosphoglucosamine mutase [Acidimicrobiia bacterium EGI L10123]